MKKFGTIGNTLKKLWSCERGAVAPLVGVCAIMLVGSVAVAVDVGRGQVAQSKLQSALDSAGLAAGAVVKQNLDEGELKAEGWKYLLKRTLPAKRSMRRSPTTTSISSFPTTIWW